MLSKIEKLETLNSQLFLQDHNALLGVWKHDQTRSFVFDVIYQTGETVFHRDIQTPAQRSIFNEIRGVCITDETLSRVFDIFSQSKHKPRSKRRSKIVKSMLSKTGYPNLFHGCNFLCFNWWIIMDSEQFWSQYQQLTVNDDFSFRDGNPDLVIGSLKVRIKELVSLETC